VSENTVGGAKSAIEIAGMQKNTLRQFFAMNRTLKLRCHVDENLLEAIGRSEEGRRAWRKAHRLPALQDQGEQGESAGKYLNFANRQGLGRGCRFIGG